jgi:hypothetical protein
MPNQRKLIWLSCGVVALAILAANAHADDDAFAVTHPLSSRKILPAARDAGPRAETVRIAMARNEYEPAQLVVRAGDADLKNVRVSTGPLTGPNGTILPVERIEINPMGYITVPNPTPGLNHLIGNEGGEVPDVLLPDRPMTIGAGRRQPWYVTVQTLRSDPPGEYRGEISVSADGCADQTFPLIVRVYDVQLPVRPHLRTAFGLDADYRKIEGCEVRTDFETILRFSKFMLKHRVSPSLKHITGILPRQKNDGTWDFELTDRYLSELVPLGLTSFYTHCGSAIPAYADHLKSKGWFDLSYVYMYDQAPTKALPQMLERYRNMREATPDAKIMQVMWSPTPPLRGLVNMWCPTLDRADLLGLRQAQERGEEAWWYTHAGPYPGYPNISHLETPGLFARIIGWMTYHYRIEGFLYWAVDVWATHPTEPEGPPLKSAAEYDAENYASWEADTYKCNYPRSPRNGDGYLLYPGPDNTPVASLRLALTRDGFEDFDVFTEVEMLARRDPDGEAEARAMELLDFGLPADAPIIISRPRWTDEDNLLFQRREAILAAGEEMRLERD